MADSTIHSMRVARLKEAWEGLPTREGSRQLVATKMRVQWRVGEPGTLGGRLIQMKTPLSTL